MVTKRVANSMLVLRIVALATAAASMALLVTNKYKFDSGAEVKYQDFNTYSLEVAIAAITCLYCIVQLPFAIYYAIRERRLIDNEFLPEFDFYGDKVTSMVLGIGIGAGFALSVELKKFIEERVKDEYGFRSTYGKILIRGFVATAFLLVSFLSMALVSFISSNNRTKKQHSYY
ncbi:CASP-like protein 4D1 [Cajanus cajan]|uniref:CASP-like protein n=1 Tax=Cajanus cajan TaxID=3821 RepID=A0A151S8E8_CAJCA|nr:CASP-like protein 4D1 [Cajanus cajan]KYP51093.1 UPF0497 membrane protein At2g39530 family [Cajanus cajan]